MRITTLAVAALATSLLGIDSHAAPAPAYTGKQLATLPGEDWPTNGGSVYNQRYSPLDEINTTNVAQLKAEWRAHLNGSGVGPPFSGEAQPVVQGGVIYVPTGADDVFALDAGTGKILWTYQSKLDPKITTVCCGWTSRGVAVADGKVFLGRLDGKLIALDQRNGNELWSVQAERWQDGFTLTSAPLYYDGMIITGFAGAEFATRGRVKAFSAKNGKLLWTFYTVPAPGEPGHETWPQDNDSWLHGGATVWQTPAVDPELGLIYFATGNPGPDFSGAVRKGDNLYTVSVVALEAKTGKYRWHFQEVHHDLWDYDATSPVVLFDVSIRGELRKGLAQVGKTGWAYILDRASGKPLVGIDERPVPQEPRQATSPTQPFPVGDPTVPHTIDIPPVGYQLVNEGGIFTPYWDKPVVAKPSPWGGTNWSPSSYDPREGYLFVCANDSMGRFVVTKLEDAESGKSYMGGQFGFSEIPRTGIFAAVDVRTNKLAWRQRWKDTCYSGSSATGGDLVFTGSNDGHFMAINSRNGDLLWNFQTDAGVNATATIFRYQGKEKIVVYSAGNTFAGSPAGDSVWLFSLDGTIGPTPPPQAAAAAVQRVSTENANVEAGGKVFTQYCALCHGEDGAGGHGGGPDITKIDAPQVVATTVTAGKNNKMPPFASVLTPDQIRDVAVYVATKLGKSK